MSHNHNHKPYHPSNNAAQWLAVVVAVLLLGFLVIVGVLTDPNGANKLRDSIAELDKKVNANADDANNKIARLTSDVESLKAELSKTNKTVDSLNGKVDKLSADLERTNDRADEWYRYIIDWIEWYNKVHCCSR